IPTLAVGAAEGADWIARRLGRWERFAGWLPASLAIAGLVWAWLGPPGRHLRHFDEQPMSVMRKAGLWLRAHGPSDARVMDRKAFIPFFAHMRHVQLPEGSTEQVVEHALRVGADYLALEEYVLLTLRPQLLPLVTDSEFLARQKQLRLIYIDRDKPLERVAIFEIVRDSAATR
ncbi:MAG TPA: hypothetical protein VEY91_13170, partial [Candidatus Limnocylindria bacterium]|nr:hypothetical protein [Candidatus Limnocylindria bacterium]